MASIQENNKRIAKNTLFLYVRMILIMGVSLFTVRVVLNTLGVVDFGIYNVVGGVVTMFSFLSGTMATASQRYFSFELGNNNLDKLKKIFSTTLFIYFIIAFVIIVIAETLGLWFLNTKMTIPPDRMNSARYVFQFSIFSFILTILTIPYKSLIIAYEQMKIYAYISIIEVVLNLLIVYLLLISAFDKLKLYSILMFGVTFIITLVYRIYSQKRYVISHFSFYWDKQLFKEILSYSGWNLFGALAGVFNNQGVNILLNVFFGPAVNAARAITYQINGALSQFVNNFIIATRPQIIKYYASNQKTQMMKLAFQSSKFSYYLLFILSMPVLIETGIIFSVWLKQIPEYAIIFTRLIIISTLIDVLSYPLMTLAHATGKIKLYQSVIGSVMLLNLPLSYVFLKLGYQPQIVFYLGIVNSILCLILRLFLLNRMVELPIKKYILDVGVSVTFVSISSYLLPIVISNQMNESIGRLLIVTIAGSLFSILSIYIVGLSKTEKEYSLNLIKNLINKINAKKFNKT